jgi:succinoglycan biosynthesis transport protein ExoP
MSEEQQGSIHFSDYWRVVKNRWPIIITVFVLVVTTAYFYSKSLTKIYSNSAVIKVNQESKDIGVFQPAGDGIAPMAFQTEFELIESQKVLHPVIEQLNLRQVWADRAGIPVEMMTMDNAYRRLKGAHIVVRPYKGTNLMEIVCNSADPKETVLFANTVAQVYKDYRENEIRQRKSEGLEVLKEELDDQKAKVQKAKAKVEELRKEVGDFVIGTSPQATSTLNTINLSKKESQLSDAKTDIMARKVRLQKVENMTIEELETALKAIGYEDPLISSLRSQYLAAQSSMDAMVKQGFGAEHPQMKSLIAAARKYRIQLNELIDGIKTGLQVDLEVAETRVQSLEAEVAALKEKQKGVRAEELAPLEEAQSDLQTEQSLYSILAARYKQLAVEQEIGIRPVEIVNRAVLSPNPAPIKPNVMLNVSIAAAAGLVLGISLAFFIEYLDTSVKSLDDVERYLQTNVVGVVPEGVNTLNLEGPDSPNAEAYRILRAKIDLQARDGNATTVTVVSGGPGEGKTTTLFNLGYVCAYSGINTLIIDTDFRRHSLNQILGIENAGGLADFLLGYGPIHEYIRNTDIPNLQVITSGKLPPQCMGALSPAKIHEISETLKPHYDVILFDAPPILGISDAAVIVHEVDQTLLAIQHRRYPRNISWRAKKVIEEVQGSLAGVVLNKVHLRSDESYYYYTSYYGYYGYYKTGSRKEASDRARENKKKLSKKNKSIASGGGGNSGAADSY